MYGGIKKCNKTKISKNISTSYTYSEPEKGSQKKGGGVGDEDV